jgi:uncharacterized LabA/DUF88 family protein
MPVVIDGPNFINAIKSHGIDNESIASYLSLTKLKYVLDMQCSLINRSWDFGRVDFVCSQKLFGGIGDKFTNDQRERMLRRFKFEAGVHVEETNNEGKEEKGVDVTVAVKLIRYSEGAVVLSLISEDKDYIPVLKYLAEKDRHVMAVKAKKGEYPEGLVNEAYACLDISESIHDLFDCNPIDIELQQLEEKSKEFLFHAWNRNGSKIVVLDDGQIKSIQPGAQMPTNTAIFWSYNRVEINEVGPLRACEKRFVAWFTHTIKKAVDANYKGDLIERYPKYILESI